MENFVPFEIAQKLKEKGYSQDTNKHNAWYATEYYKNSCLGEYFEGELTPIGEYGNKINALHIIEVENKGVIAPTISQVLKWLRESKKMFVQISLFQYCYDYCILDTEMVYYDNEHKVLHQGPTGYSYEEAAIAGIEYCLDNLI